VVKIPGSLWTKLNIIAVSLAALKRTDEEFPVLS